MYLNQIAVHDIKFLIPRVNSSKFQNETGTSWIAGKRKVRENSSLSVLDSHLSRVTLLQQHYH